MNITFKFLVIAASLLLITAGIMAILGEYIITALLVVAAFVFGVTAYRSAVSQKKETTEREKKE